jgi:hypothetical protein
MYLVLDDKNEIVKVVGWLIWSLKELSSTINWVTTSTINNRMKKNKEEMMLAERCCMIGPLMVNGNFSFRGKTFI